MLSQIYFLSSENPFFFLGGAFYLENLINSENVAKCAVNFAFNFIYSSKFFFGNKLIKFLGKWDFIYSGPLKEA
jgi:hypothetical protein